MAEHSKLTDRFIRMIKIAVTITDRMLGIPTKSLPESERKEKDRGKEKAKAEQGKARRAKKKDKKGQICHIEAYGADRQKK